jgi:hypothetical protein
MVPPLRLLHKCCFPRWSDSHGTGVSKNHPALGGGLALFLYQIAGLAEESEANALVFRPERSILTTIGSASLQTATPQGLASFSWRSVSADVGHLQINVSLPHQMSAPAAVHIPLPRDAEASLLDGVVIWERGCNCAVWPSLHSVTITGVASVVLQRSAVARRMSKVSPDTVVVRLTAGEFRFVVKTDDDDLLSQCVISNTPTITHEEDGRIFKFGSKNFTLSFEAQSLAILNISTCRTGVATGHQGFLWPTGDVPAIKRFSLWQLNFSDCSETMPAGTQIDALRDTHAANTSYTTSSVPGGLVLTLSWYGVQSASHATVLDAVLDVNVTITMLDVAPRQVTLHGSVRKHSRQPRICLQNMALPNLEHLVFRTPEQDTAFAPYYFGNLGALNHICGAGYCTLDMWRDPIDPDGEYAFMPNGNRQSMQWAAFYSSSSSSPPAPPLGLYVGAHAPQANMMMLLMQASYVSEPAGQQHAGLRWLHVPTNLLDSHSEFWSIPYDVVLAGFDGDWYDAAMIYRAWALDAAVWTQQGNLSVRSQAEDYPHWLLEAPL